jgi:hypothetical protein
MLYWDRFQSSIFRAIQSSALGATLQWTKKKHIFIQESFKLQAIEFIPTQSTQVDHNPALKIFLVNLYLSNSELSQ